MKRWLVLLVLCAAAWAQSGVPILGSTQAPAAGGAGPTLFTYVASSVTGCLNDTNTTQTACSTTLHQTPGAGHLLVMFVCWIGTFGSQNMAVTGTQTWTAVGSPKQGAGTLTSFQCQAFRVFSATNSATTVTATISSGSTTFIVWEAAEYSYTGSLASLDPANGTGFTNSNTAASSSTITVNSSANTVGTSDLIFGWCGVVDSACSGGAGFTTRNDTAACHATNSAGGCGTSVNINTGNGALLEEKVNQTAGAKTVTFGSGTTDNNIAGLIAFGQ